VLTKYPALIIKKDFWIETLFERISRHATDLVNKEIMINNRTGSTTMGFIWFKLLRT
jgi:hypothetical protein